MRLEDGEGWGGKDRQTEAGPLGTACTFISGSRLRLMMKQDRTGEMTHSSSHGTVPPRLLQVGKSHSSSAKTLV